MSQSTDVMEKIVALCRRRGFIFGSSEIYGGIGGFWDYGPLGCELKKNIKDVWWSDMVRNPPPGPDGREFQMVGVDCSIIMNPKVWEASGHVGGFSDPMRDCKDCKLRYRSDWLTRWGFFQVPQIPKSAISIHDVISGIKPGTVPSAIMISDGTPGSSILELNKEAKKRLRARTFEWVIVPHHPPVLPGEALTYCVADGKSYFCMQWVKTFDLSQDYCPNCGGQLTEPRAFNLMFKTNVGAVEDASSVAYLRPETAQGIFANFKNVMDSTRVKIPFGIAQVGKAFRNEINPRNFTFRSREFEQMEIEFFCKPDESMAWYEFWRDTRINWYTSLGIKSGNLRPRQQGEKELAHYSKACTDIEYLFPFSDEPQELEGVAHRGSFDLNQHGKFSRDDENAFAVIDEDQSRDREGAGPPPGQKASRYVPHVIEPSAGADRFTLAVICEAYSYDESRASPEYMRFHPRLAPIKAAVFPLVAKDGLPEIAEPIFREIKKHYPCQYDAKQSIGKRYARMDEAGTPYCFTIDGQSKEDGTITVRNRDDASQIRIDKSRCLEYLREQLRI